MLILRRSLQKIKQIRHFQPVLEQYVTSIATDTPCSDDIGGEAAFCKIAKRFYREAILP